MFQEQIVEFALNNPLRLQVAPLEFLPEGAGLISAHPSRGASGELSDRGSAHSSTWIPQWLSGTKGSPGSQSVLPSPRPASALARTRSRRDRRLRPFRTTRQTRERVQRLTNTRWKSSDLLANRLRLGKERSQSKPLNVAH